MKKLLLWLEGRLIFCAYNKLNGWVKRQVLDSSWFKHWYTDKVKLKNEVEIIIDKEWKKDIMDVRSTKDHIIALRLIVEQYIFSVVS